MLRELEKIALPHDAFAERLAQRERDLAKARGFAEFSPGMRMSGNEPGIHPAMEKEIIKQTGPGLGAKVRHHTIGRVKRMWSLPGPTRWLQRAGLIGGVAGAGLIGKQWYEASKNQKELQRMQELLDQRPQYKMGATYLPDAPITPKAAKLPSLPMPMSTNAGPPKLPGVAGNIGVAAVGSKSKDVTGVPKMETAKAAGLLNKIAFLDQGIGPLLAGGAGGIGGYLLGSKVIDPLLAGKQQTIREQMARGEKWIGNLEKGRKVAPFAGAIAGALLLAAIASHHAKKQERERIERVLMMGGRPEEGGFYSQDTKSVNDPTAAFYG